MQPGADILNYEETKILSNEIAVNAKFNGPDVGRKLGRIASSVKTNKSNEEVNKLSKEHNKNTAAFRALKQSFDFVELYGKLLGWTLDYKWKGGPRHWFTMTYLAFTWSQFWYSQYLYFNNGQYIQIFEVFAIYGVASSCVLKVICFKRYFKDMTALHHFSLKFCKESIGERADKLEKRLFDILKLYKLISFLALMSALLYVYYPIKVFIVDHEYMPLLPIEIILTDQSTLSGFLIANMFMVVMGLYAVFGSMYIGLHFVGAIFSYSLQVDIIEIDFNDLDKFWSDKSTTTIFTRHMLLRNICMKCQDKDNYITAVKKVFDLKIYLYFCVAYLSQIICLYVVKAENWISGYGIAFGLFVELMFYCFIGTKTTIENERLCYIITQSNWYNYDIHSKKMILLLLNSCMNANELWIGPLAPLSVYTGTEIVKSIYSYYTILAEVM